MARPFDGAIFDPAIFDVDSAVGGGEAAGGGIAVVTHPRGPLSLQIPDQPWRRKRIRVKDQAAIALFAAGAISEDELAVLLAA
jgi:hypothetical protein